MAKIQLIHGDTITKELWLSDCGHTWEIKGNPIEWDIRNPNTSNVASIENIVVTSGAEIFSELPNNRTGKWRAKIHNNAQGDVECKYSIFWIPKGATESLEHDPKISVKPSFNERLLLIPIITIAAACALYWLPKISNIRRK